MTAEAPIPVPAAPGTPTPGDESSGARQTAEDTCPRCGGSGQLSADLGAAACPDCAGTGRVTVTVGDA